MTMQETQMRINVIDKDDQILIYDAETINHC